MKKIFAVTIFLLSSVFVNASYGLQSGKLTSKNINAAKTVISEEIGSLYNEETLKISLGDEDRADELFERMSKLGECLSDLRAIEIRLIFKKLTSAEIPTSCPLVIR